MKHIFDQGKSIIITGRQGVGTTSLAQAIAGGIGASVVTVQMQEMFSAFNSLWAIEGTVIVEGFNPSSRPERSLAKSLTSQDTAVVNRVGEEPATAEMPNFIFVTGDKDFLPPGLEGRRFLVVNLS